MRRTLTILAAGVVGASVIAAGPQAQQQRPADVTHELEMEIGGSDAVSGAPQAGINPYNFSEDYYRCESGPDGHCEAILIKAVNPYEEENAKKGRERANLFMQLTSTTPAGDFALQVWESDESGARGEYVGYADIDPGTTYEDMTIVVTSTEDSFEHWYRVEVIYWAMAGDYTLDVEFVQ